MGVDDEEAIADCFNPVLGFLPASTSDGTEQWRFSTFGFNPVLGFLPASTFDSTSPSLALVDVSIPFWVFSLPRPTASCEERRGGHVSIPFWVFSLPRQSEVRVRVRRAVVSIPFWVFSLPRPHRIGCCALPTRFQSRSGFSPCLDERG